MVWVTFCRFLVFLFSIFKISLKMLSYWIEWRYFPFHLLVFESVSWLLLSLCRVGISCIILSLWIPCKDDKSNHPLVIHQSHSIIDEPRCCIWSKTLFYCVLENRHHCISDKLPLSCFVFSKFSSINYLYCLTVEIFWDRKYRFVALIQGSSYINALAVLSD